MHQTKYNGSVELHESDFAVNQKGSVAKFKPDVGLFHYLSVSLTVFLLSVGLTVSRSEATELESAEPLLYFNSPSSQCISLLIPALC